MTKMLSLEAQELVKKFLENGGEIKTIKTSRKKDSFSWGANRMKGNISHSGRKSFNIREQGFSKAKV